MMNRRIKVSDALSFQIMHRNLEERIPNLTWIGRHIFSLLEPEKFQVILVNSRLIRPDVSFLCNLDITNAILINSRPSVLSRIKKSAKNEKESIHS